MTISLSPSTILNGSGIDVSSIVQQIISSQNGEMSIWQTQQTGLSTDEGLLSGMENNLTALQTSVQALADPTGAMTALAATSSDDNVLTANATSSAVDGTHTVTVTNLATVGMLYSDPIAAGANTSFLPSGATGGSLTLNVGSTAHTIAITPGTNDTVSSLAQYIDQQNWGVTASVSTDSSGARLALVSQNTGTNGALSISGNTTAGTTLDTSDVADPNATSLLPSGQQSGDFELEIGGASGTTADIQIGPSDTLSSLKGDINTQSQANNWGLSATIVSDSGGSHLQITSSATGTAGTVTLGSNNTTTLTANNPATNLQFMTAEGGTNAQFTIDGVSFSSQSNTVTGAIQGVTMSLLNQAPGSPVTLTVGPDVNQITDAINNFVSAYNTAVSTINTQYSVSSTPGVPAPPLLGDATLQTVQTSLLSDVGFAMPLTDGSGNTNNSGLINLASLGINMNNDGTLTVGSTPVGADGSGGQTFAQILAANPAAVLNFFQNATTGFANNFATTLQGLTDATSGPLNAELANDQAEGQDLTNTINNFQAQLTTEQTALTTQFDSVNASLESYPLLLQLSTQILGTLNAGTSSSGSTVASAPTLTAGL